MPMRMRLLLVLVLACLAMVTQAGCQSGGQAVAHSSWDPNYWEDCLAASNGSYPQITLRALWQLSNRAAFDDYWRLVATVLEVSPRAESLIIIEKLAEDKAYYCWLVLARSSGTTHIYANTDRWLAMIPGAPDAGGSGQSPIGGKASDEEAKALFAAMDRRGIWARDSGVYAPCGDNPEIDGGPFAVHIYRRDHNVSINWVVEGLDIDSAVVRGRTSVADVAQYRIRPAETEVPASSWDTMSDEQRSAWAQHDEQTYPVRLVVNGALRVLMAELERHPAGR